MSDTTQTHSPQSPEREKPLANEQWEFRFGGTLEDDGFTVAERGNGGLVCEFYPPALTDEDRPRMVERGKLIVAAPDLLTVAKESLACFEAIIKDMADKGIDITEFPRCGKFEGIGTRLKKAIAKAGGAA